jgi:hypothetical protein
MLLRSLRRAKEIYFPALQRLTKSFKKAILVPDANLALWGLAENERPPSMTGWFKGIAREFRVRHGFIR